MREERRARLSGLVDRFFTPLLVLAVGIFSTLAISSAIRDGQPDGALVSYSIQEVERVTPESGEIYVPLLDGYQQPAICIGDTVPTRGTVTNSTDHPLEIAGSLVWEHIPPGPRVQVIADVPAVQPPGTRSVFYENTIPPSVVEMTLAEGEASLWRITGLVEVFEPRALPAAWTTAQFWVVDC